MSAANSIQAFGIEAVLKAYTAKGSPAFSIWSGKNMNMKYDGFDADGNWSEPNISEGEQILAAYLKSIYTGSNAIYTLKTYDGLSDEEKITPKTEYDTCFNFRLYDIGSGYNRPTSESPAIIELLTRMDQRIAAIEMNNNFDDDDEEEEEQEEAQTIGSVLIGLLQDPEKLTKLIRVGKELLGFDTPAAVANITPIRTGQNELPGNQPAAPGIGNLSQGDIDSISNSLDILGANDPDIAKHLEKLANMAKNNPKKFQSLISMLDVFN